MSKPLDDDFNVRPPKLPKPNLDGDTDTNKAAKKWSAMATVSGAENLPPTDMAFLRVEIPAYLDRELTLKAASERVTKQYLVLQALVAHGYHVENHDLVPDKRRARRQVGS